METPEYEPLRDENLNVCESLEDYLIRLRSGVLPNFPEEVLTEWFYRHHDCLHTYSSLDYQTLRFEKQQWQVEHIPGKEVFREGSYGADFAYDFDLNLSQGNWLARYMNEHGTWNTPIILLANTQGTLVDCFGLELTRPYHLLEGHNRLEYLIVLRDRGKALAHHWVWLVSKEH